MPTIGLFCAPCDVRYKDLAHFKVSGLQSFTCVNPTSRMTRDACLPGTAWAKISCCWNQAGSMCSPRSLYIESEVCPLLHSHSIHTRTRSFKMNVLHFREDVTKTQTRKCWIGKCKLGIQISSWMRVTVTDVSCCYYTSNPKWFKDCLRVRVRTKLSPEMHIIMAQTYNMNCTMTQERHTDVYTYTETISCYFILLYIHTENI